MKQYFRILKEFVWKKEIRKEISLISLILCISSALTFVIPMITNSVIDVLTQGKSKTQLDFVCLVSVIIMAISLFINCFQNLIINKLIQKQSVTMKMTIFETSIKKEWGFYGKYTTGELLYRLHSDAVVIAENAAMLPLNVGISILVILAVNIVLGRIMLKISLLLDVILLTSSLVTVFLMKKSQQYSQEIQSKGEALYSITQEGMERAQLMRLYQAYEKEISKCSNTMNIYAEKLFDKTYFIGNANAFIAFISSLWTAGVLWIGGIAVSKGFVSLGELVAFLSIANLLMPLGNRLGQTVLYFPMFKVSLKRYFEILDAKEVSMEAGNQNAHIENGSIELRNVTYGYEGTNRKVLTDYSLTIEPNSLVLLKGNSGAGKSTIMKLIMRLCQPEEGNIFIGGRDISEYTEKELRNKIAYLGDYCSCFEGSILENITYGMEQYEMEEVNHVIMQVDLQNVIDRLPDGVFTIIGKNGIDLSEGEKQRVALARCLILKPKIILIDEGTSNLDVETEKTIYRRLRERAKNATVITISHRLEVMEYVDEIISI